MAKITVQTAHNVTIEYNLASIGDRMLALFIDWLVQIAYLVGFFYLIAYMNNSLSSVPSWLVIIFLLPISFYELFSETILEGQTLGKRAMNIKVIMLDGSQPRISNYFLRWLIRLFEIPLSFGVVAIVSLAISTKGQRIGDVAAGTSIIKLRSSKNIKRPLLSELENAENYLPMFPQVVNLSDKDINIAREVLETYHKTGNLELIKTINYRLKEVLNLYNTTNFSDVVLLKQFLKDYDNLTSK